MPRIILIIPLLLAVSTLEIIFCAFLAENYFVKVLIPFIGVRRLTAMSIHLRHTTVRPHLWNTPEVRSEPLPYARPAEGLR